MDVEMIALILKWIVKLLALGFEIEEILKELGQCFGWRGLIPSPHPTSFHSSIYSPFCFCNTVNGTDT